MVFRQSAVSQITHDEIIEESPSLPLDIQPALLGSGELALGLDATGMQGLNVRMNQFRDTLSLFGGLGLTACNLHLYRDEALSSHYQANEIANESDAYFALLPCGWVDYVLSIDGEQYDAKRLAAEGCEWSRAFRPRSGILTTSFSIGPVAIAWTTAMAPDAVEVDFSFEANSTDGKQHQIGLLVRCHQTLRDGTAITRGGIKTTALHDCVIRCWHGTSETSMARLYAPIAVSWAIAFQSPATYEHHADFIAARWSETGTVVGTGIRVICGSDRDGTQLPEYALERVAALKKSGVDSALAEIAGCWGDYFDEGAELWVGEIEKEFLTLQQQYLLRAGHPWHSGIPLGTLWTRNFLSGTFWDSFFCVDGMLRSGHVLQVRAFCEWVVKSAQRTGRPHYWITYYDGQPSSTADKAYQVVLAFAGACIRLYEFTRDRKDLELRVYPYLRRVAEYLFDEVIERTTTSWRLRGDVAGDIDGKPGEASVHHGILAWVVTSIAKCGEYAKVLGVEDALTAQCQKVDAHFRATPINLSKPGLWSTWLPYLTGDEVHADFESWWTFAKETRAQIPMCLTALQPWEGMSNSASYTLTGHPDLGLKYQEDAMDFVYGLGCFSEVAPEWRFGWSFVPYPPATSSWLSCTLAMFAQGSLWNDDVLIGVNLPTRYLYNRLRWRGVTTLNGVRTSGFYNPHRLHVKVETSRPRRITLRVPGRIAGEPIRVRVDGNEVSAESDGRVAHIYLPAGTHDISLDRDVERETDILLVEPLDFGQEIVEALEQAGHSVRWLRDFDSLPQVIGKASLIVLHGSYSSLPHDLLAPIEQSARNGAQILTLFHAGCSSFDSEMAELTGVRATLAGRMWNFHPSPHNYRVTADGRAQLHGLQQEFSIPAHHELQPRLLDDVQVLVVDAENDWPTVTWRPLGSGGISWIASAGRAMGTPDNYQNANLLARNTRMWGIDADTMAPRQWLTDENWRALFLAMIRTQRAMQDRPVVNARD